MIRLGERRSATGDATALLSECHQRIRSFLALARRIGAADLTDDRDLREAAAGVHRYFTQALPLHARDEEESVLPRLRGRDAALDSALDQMAREHAEHARPLAALVGACGALVAEPGRHRQLAPTIAGAAEELERHFEVHLRREEEVIFPAMRRLLEPAADAAIVKELRARRAPIGERGGSAGPTPAIPDAG